MGKTGPVGGQGNPGKAGLQGLPGIPGPAVSSVPLIVDAFSLLKPTRVCSAVTYNGPYNVESEQMNKSPGHASLLSALSSIKIYFKKST